MSYFLALLLKIIPLYVLIALGYIASKNKSIRKETISSLLIYIFAPVVVFHSVIQMELKPELLTLPFLMFGLCAIAAALFYFIGKLFWKDAHKNILAFAASQGNAGYFGIPVALMLFGQDILGIYILLWLGAYIFGYTGGYLVVAHGKHTLSESLRKFAKVPVIYAFILALIFNFLGINLGESILGITEKFTGAYAILGMMILGLSLSNLKKTSLDWTFTILAFIARFVFWPILAFLVIYVDQNFWHIYDDTIHQLIILISIVPIAADTVAFATEFNTHPQKVALTVFLSTLFALVYIPAILSLVF
ncbi:AEC family transporter [Patescibacteria group bacterium]